MSASLSPAAPCGQPPEGRSDKNIASSGYPGSKGQAGVFQRIIGQMPPHSTYVEPFFGSGQIFWRKRRAAESIIIDKVPDLIAKAGAETGVHAISGDALEQLALLAPALAAEAVVYCDPPYVLSTRQNRFYYAHEFSDHDHRDLLTLLNGLKCHVLLSGYPSELYESMLRAPSRFKPFTVGTGWRCMEYRTRTRGRTVTECLWCNFPEPTDLHDWRYAGQNFRERLYYSRLSKRWLAKLEAMPERKRNFLLDAIIEQRYSRRGRPVSSAENGAGIRFSREVLVKVQQIKSDDPAYVARGYIGQMKIWESQERCMPLQVMFDAQDWATIHGKTLKFETT